MNQKRTVIFFIIVSLLILGLWTTGNNTLLSHNNVPDKILIGEELIKLTSGDFVYPKLSPNGRYLAYSEVLVDENNKENTRVLVYDTHTKNKQILIDKEKAKEFAIYKTFVINCEWIDNNHLKIGFSDGDVGSIYVTVNILTKRIINEESKSAGIYFTKDETEKINQILNTFPDKFEDYEVYNIIFNSSIFLSKNKIVYGNKGSIFHMDLQKEKIRKILNGSTGVPKELKGGFVFKDNLVILVGSNSGYNIYQFKQDLSEYKIITKINNNKQTSLKPIHFYQHGVVFLVNSGRSYEKSNNLLFYFNGSELYRISNYKNIYQIDIDGEGKRVVCSYWEEDERHLKLNRLRFK